MSPAGESLGAPAGPTEPVQEPLVDRAGALPVWFDAAVLVPASVVGCATLVGLPLALVGQFRGWLVALLSVVAGVGLALSVLRKEPSQGRGGRAAAPVALASVVVAAALAVVLSWSPGQHVVQDRDPGSYFSTAVWLDRYGSLTGNVRAGGIEVLRPSEYGFEFAGVYDMGGGRAEFQFNHGTSVVLATARSVGGTALLLRASALLVALAMLALVAVSTAALRRPWVALVAAVATAVSLPWWFVARDAYSEPATMLLYWSALLVLLRLVRRPSIAGGLLAGMLAGAAVVVRADAALLVAPVLVVMGGVVGSAPAPGRRELRRAGAAALGVLLLSFAVALVDLLWFSGRYFRDHRPMMLVAVAALVIGAAVAAGLAVVVPRAPDLVDRARSVLARAALPCAVVMVLLLLAMWWVRPFVQVGRAPMNLGLADLQRLLGLDPDGTRSYAEDSVRWMSWYLGPVVLMAAVAGAGVAVFKVLRFRAPLALVLVAVPGLLGAVLYLYDPKITPDHPWVLRRFAPSVVPTLCVLAGLVVVELWGTGTGTARWRRPAAAVLGVLMVVSPAAGTWPVRQMAPQRSYLDAVLKVCDAVGPRGTVVVAGAVETIALQHTLRSWCGVPVVAASARFGPGSAARLVDAAAAQGRSVWVVSFDPQAATLLGARPAGPPAVISADGDRRSPRQTLLGPPDGYDSRDPLLRNAAASSGAASSPPFRLFVQRVDGATAP